MNIAEIGIGEMSHRTGVKVTTIRFYENEGLMPVPERNTGNQRRYSEAHLAQLGFIAHARDLGLPMKNVKELVQLSRQPQRSCAEANQIATQHLSDVRDRIERLRSLEVELERIATSCNGGTIGECSIIAALGDHGQCGGEHRA